MRPIRVTTTDASGGATNSNAAVLNTYGVGPVAIQVIVTGTVNWTVYVTNDDVNGAGVTPNWVAAPAALAGKTATVFDSLAFLPAAIKLTQASGSGSCVMTVLQPGQP